MTSDDSIVMTEEVEVEDVMMVNEEEVEVDVVIEEATVVAEIVGDVRHEAKNNRAY
jgi:hypothetical protein